MIPKISQIGRTLNIAAIQSARASNVFHGAEIHDAVHPAALFLYAILATQCNAGVIPISPIIL